MRRLWHRHPDVGDDFALVQRGGEQALKIVIRRNLAGVGHDRGPTGQRRGRIAGRRVVIGKRATDGAAIAHCRIADLPRQRRQGRIAVGGCGFDLCVGGCATDCNGITIRANTAHFCNTAEADQGAGHRQTLFQRRDQRLPPTQGLRVLFAQSLHRIGDGRGLLELEFIHVVSFPKTG